MNLNLEQLKFFNDNFDLLSYSPNNNGDYIINIEKNNVKYYLYINKKNNKYTLNRIFVSDNQNTYDTVYSNNKQITLKDNVKFFINTNELAFDLITLGRNQQSSELLFETNMQGQIIQHLNQNELQNLKIAMNNILQDRIQKSDGFDYGLYNQLNYSRIVANCQNTENIRLFKEINKNDFQQIAGNQNQLQAFFNKFNLQIKQNENDKPNFAIIPVCANGHISTLLIDLSPNKQNENKSFSDRLYSFDSSTYHYQLDIFNGLVQDNHKVNKENIQLTGCCGYWTFCFIEEYSKITDIEEVKKQCQSGEMQLKVACKVSDTIDLNRNEHNICFIKKIHIPLQISDEISQDELDLDNFIKINIKNTNQYYLLDKNNIYKSTCINLETIYNLTQQQDSGLIISEKDKELIKEQIIKQNQEIFKLKQNRIDELNKAIQNECIDKLNIQHTNTDDEKKWFAEYLAKMEYYKNRLDINMRRQEQFLEKGDTFLKNGFSDHTSFIEKKCILTNKNNNSNSFHKNKNNFNQINTKYGEYLNMFNTPNKFNEELKKYFEERQTYYKQLTIIEQQEMKGDLNLLGQTKQTPQLQKPNHFSCLSQITSVQKIPNIIPTQQKYFAEDLKIQMAKSVPTKLNVGKFQ